ASGGTRGLRRTPAIEERQQPRRNLAICLNLMITWTWRWKSERKGHNSKHQQVCLLQTWNKYNLKVSEVTCEAVKLSYLMVQNVVFMLLSCVCVCLIVGCS
ncbi:unnamed protein product, partial [Urochloa humidicola]